MGKAEDLMVQDGQPVEKMQVTISPRKVLSVEKSGT